MDRRSGLKLEMTSTFFVVLKSSWPILYSYKVCQTPNGRAEPDGFLPSPSIVRVSRTPSETRLSYIFNNIYEDNWIF